MTLAPSITPIADLIADLLRRAADAISPPRVAAPPAKPEPPPAYDPDKDRAMLSHAFADLPPHLRRDLGVDV